MAEARTTVEILDKSGNRVGRVKNLYPINESGMILQYSKELSDYGTCKFRVATSDPMLTDYGDILTPHKYQVRIKRGQYTVWQGGIIDNTERNKNYIEVKAAELLWYLDRILVRRDAEDNPGDGKNNFRVFSSGTMATAVTTIISEVAADVGSNHVLAALSAGTIENPDYPDGLTTAAGDPLTGAWTFTSDISLQFDYHSVLYVLKSFGIYTGADFEIEPDGTLNFKKRLGNKLHKFSLQYGTFGNIVDYNLPRLGTRMANSLVGIAATDDYTIFHHTATDQESIDDYGLLQQAAAYSDVKGKNALKVRLNEELRFVRSPEVSPVNLVLNENAYPLGQYEVGDTLQVKVEDHNISFTGWRKIVGITVTLHNTGRELIVVQTNEPRAADLEEI